MLILSRKLEEEICIGDNVTIKVLDIQNGHVRLGISAPREVVVHRSEVLDRIRLEGLRQVDTK